MRSSSVYAGGPFSVLYYFLILMVTTDLLPTLVAAPSGPPLNISVEATTPRTLYFSWEPPLLEQQNGVISGYVVNIISEENGMVFQIYSNNNATNISATLFTPYTVYRCTMASSTMPGTGPYSNEVLILTPEDGKHNGKIIPTSSNNKDLLTYTLPSDMYCKSIYSDHIPTI